MRYIIVNLIILLSAINSFSQAVKYKEPFFRNINVQKDLLYDSNNNIKTKYRQFDFYESADDSSAKRPLIIWLHGGGFKFGTKNAKEIKIWCNEFAQCGYAIAAVNYRLSKKHPITQFKDLVEACYDNVTDVKNATAFFKLHAQQFKIDTTKIIIGGNSAGGVIALQSVYSNAADIQNVVDSNKAIANTGSYNAEHFAAVINFWGAMFNVDWLSRANVAIISVHGAKDRIVPIDDRGVAFFGSLAIHNKADALHIPNDIKFIKAMRMNCRNILTRFSEAAIQKEDGKKLHNFLQGFYIKHC